MAWTAAIIHLLCPRTPGGCQGAGWGGGGTATFKGLGLLVKEKQGAYLCPFCRARREGAVRGSL